MGQNRVESCCHSYTTLSCGIDDEEHDECGGIGEVIICSPVEFGEQDSNTALDSARDGSILSVSDLLCSQFD